MLPCQARHLAISAAFNRIGLAFAFQRSGRKVFQHDFAAVGEQHRQFDSVIQRLTVSQRVGAGGVVADHAADGGPVRCRSVGAKL